MGLTKVNQENEGASIPNASTVKGIKAAKSFGKSTPSKGKSLIPVPKTSLSPKNDENASPAVQLGLKSRRPLAPMQHGESPQVLKSTGKIAPKKSEHSSTPAKVKTVEQATGTDAETNFLPAGVQLHRSFAGTPHNSPSKLKTRKSSIVGSIKKTQKSKTEEKTNEKETIAYWKELAESRRQALDAALEENYELHKRVEDLEKENAHLEEIVKEAEKLAQMVNDAADEEEVELDESGIVDTKLGTAV